MKSVESEKENLERIIKMIAHQFGDKCEVVLHDLQKDYSSTIVAIEHNHITGRKIGGSGSNLGLEVLRGNTQNGDRYNYLTRLPDGKLLRSSTTYLKDDEGKVLGSICVNFDVSDLIMMESMLQDYMLIDKNVDEDVNEVFANNVNELLDYFLLECHKKIGKLPDAMTKEDKIKAVQFLDQKGVFLITKSGDRVCEYLGISKYTLYSYMDMAKKI